MELNDLKPGDEIEYGWESNPQLPPTRATVLFVGAERVFVRMDEGGETSVRVDSQYGVVRIIPKPRVAWLCYEGEMQRCFFDDEGAAREWVALVPERTIAKFVEELP